MKLLSTWTFLMSLMLFCSAEQYLHVREEAIIQTDDGKFLLDLADGFVPIVDLFADDEEDGYYYIVTGYDHWYCRCCGYDLNVKKDYCARCGKSRSKCE